MPFILAFLGIMLIVSGAKGTIQPLGTQLVNDFTGQNNFFYWVFAIIIIGSIGYIPGARRLSWAFLGLILLVMFLANANSSQGGGFWVNLTSAIASAKPAPAATTATSAQGTTSNPLFNLGGLDPNILHYFGIGL